MFYNANEKLSELGQLVVRCKKCGGIYPSGIFVDDLESIQRNPDRFNPMKTTCRFCGQENQNNLLEMRFTVLL
jgi:hypothetical protein